MTTIAAAVLLAVITALPQPQAGHLSRYNEGPTKYTLRARLAWGHVTPAQMDRAKVYVAALSCDDIGQEGMVTISDGSQEAVTVPYLVFDCAGVDAFEWMVNGNILFELDNKAAAEYMGQGGAWGEVSE